MALQSKLYPTAPYVRSNRYKPCRLCYDQDQPRSTNPSNNSMPATPVEPRSSPPQRQHLLRLVCNTLASAVASYSTRAPT